jgi:hypothetical protein
MASNGGAPYRCSSCGRRWSTGQALGGHKSSGRCKCAQAPWQPLPPPPPPPEILSRQLAPNPAFWEQYRRGGNRPAQINFLGLPAILLNGNVPEPSNSAAEEPQVKDGMAEL